MSKNGEAPGTSVRTADDAKAATPEQAPDAAQAAAPNGVVKPDLDEFGLPIRKRRVPSVTSEPSEVANGDTNHDADADAQEPEMTGSKTDGAPNTVDPDRIAIPIEGAEKPNGVSSKSEKEREAAAEADKGASAGSQTPREDTDVKTTSDDPPPPYSPTSAQPVVASEFSHQHTVAKPAKEEKPAEEEEWQDMPAYAPFDIYNDDGKLVAREQVESDDEAAVYNGLGGAGKGYTKIQLDDDAESATSMDDNTAYLFKELGTNVVDEDEDSRDVLAQMQATKDLLTDTQKIAYVGLTRLAMVELQAELTKRERTRATRKLADHAAEGFKMLAQKMMLRLYSHMDIEAAEQLMIEQLSEHGVQHSDMSPTLMKNARVKNPMVEAEDAARASTSSSRPSNLEARPSTSASRPSLSEARPSTSGSRPSTSEARPSVSEQRLPTSGPQPSAPTSETSTSEPTQEGDKKASRDAEATLPQTLPTTPEAKETDSPPPYDINTLNNADSEAIAASDLPKTETLDIDLRWTVLCDLFLVLVADSVFDARSRLLLERVGSYLEVSWLDICRFEKRITEALEMQEAADKENWDEEEHLEARRKRQRNRRLAMMGLATVGGSLVIGLSAGLLAPLIGAGLAAGFTTIGVAGTGTFLTGAGGIAIVASTGVVSGGTIGVRAASKRTGAVKTFEYRPLHNNKRTHLVVTVSGWMTGKVDDVRLPFSTVNPVMGDIYSLHFEPEMLRSMGDTIAILASEALTQTLQQILGSTILITLMAALQLPIVLTKLSYLIDNPWSNSLARAHLAGLIMADSLIDRNLGTRPITLVGFSLGAKVIMSCLLELASKGMHGLIQNVYMFGSPVIAQKDNYLKARAVVAGRFVNGYARNDWILGYLFRATGGGIMRVAGLAPAEFDGIENVDLSEFVPGHMSYRAAIPKILRHVGWAVESDEFTEIEDPDPENHGRRQRELINEIEEARRELEKKQTQKSRFGFFRRNKKTEKKEWETYDDRLKGGVDPEGGDAEGGVLFDVDAIRAQAARAAAESELAAEGIEIRELETTLPPMRLDSPSPSSQTAAPPLKASRSYNDAIDKSNGEGPALSRVSTNPPQASYDSWDAYDEKHKPPTNEDNVSMTFDTEYKRPPSQTSFRSSPQMRAESSPQRLPDRSSKTSLEPPALPPKNRRPPTPSHKDAVTQRPPLTTNPSSASVPIEHNAWADEDEYGLGKEKEMKMTFE